MALREIRTVVATLLHKYDISFAEGFDEAKYYDEMRDDSVLTNGQFPVVLKLRVR